MTKTVSHVLRFLALLVMVSPLFAAGLFWPWMDKLGPTLFLSNFVVGFCWLVGCGIICTTYGGDTKNHSLNWLHLFIMGGLSGIVLFSTAICLLHGPVSGTILLAYLATALLVLATWMWQRIRPAR